MFSYPNPPPQPEEYLPKPDGEGYWIPLYSVMKHQDTVREVAPLAALAKKDPKLLIDWINAMGHEMFERVNLWKLGDPAFKFVTKRAKKLHGVQGGDPLSPRNQHITVEAYLDAKDAVEMKLRFKANGEHCD